MRQIVPCVLSHAKGWWNCFISISMAQNGNQQQFTDQLLAIKADFSENTQSGTFEDMVFLNEAMVVLILIATPSRQYDN